MYKSLLKYVLILLIPFAISTLASAEVASKSSVAKPAVQKAAKPAKAADKTPKDWARLCRYEEANSKVTKKPLAVFMGDSITDFWINKSPAFFANNNFIDRGIAGQTTLQMVVRFRNDVVKLKPKYVFILAGINDIAQNLGYIKLEDVAGNIFTMAEFAKAHGITPIICSVLPCDYFPWNKKIKPAEKVKELNKMLMKYAKENDIRYVDYYSAVVNEKGGLSKELAADGVHPTLAGYKKLEPIALEALK